MHLIITTTGVYKLSLLLLFVVVVHPLYKTSNRAVILILGYVHEYIRTLTLWDAQSCLPGEGSTAR